MRKKKVITGFEEINILDPKDKQKIYSNKSMDSRCPRGLTCLPDSPCPKALNTIYNQGDASEQREWFIVHADSNYCFFAYQHLHAKSHTLDEIANLTNSTITSVDLLTKRALDKIKQRFKTRQELMKFIESLSQNNEQFDV